MTSPLLLSAWMLRWPLLLFAWKLRWLSSPLLLFAWMLLLFAWKLHCFGYNQNRDHQLEAMCVKGLKRHLEVSGWLNIQELESFNIYYMMGRSRDSCCAEWEGGVVANDPDGGMHVFLVDSSNTMDVKKVNSCRDRFLRTIKHTVNVNGRKRFLRQIC
jgi:hypothetical protein